VQVEFRSVSTRSIHGFVSSRLTVSRACTISGRVSSGLSRLVNHFALEAHGDLLIKGKTQPVCVYSVPVDSLVAETA
jgi:class 3 adenylate cyclase